MAGNWIPDPVTGKETAFNRLALQPYIQYQTYRDLNYKAESRSPGFWLPTPPTLSKTAYCWNMTSLVIIHSFSPPTKSSTLISSPITVKKYKIPNADIVLGLIFHKLQKKESVRIQPTMTSSHSFDSKLLIFWSIPSSSPTPRSGEKSTDSSRENKMAKPISWCTPAQKLGLSSPAMKEWNAELWGFQRCCTYWQKRGRGICGSHLPGMHM